MSVENPFQAGDRVQLESELDNETYYGQVLGIVRSGHVRVQWDDASPSLEVHGDLKFEKTPRPLNNWELYNLRLEARVYGAAFKDLRDKVDCTTEAFDRLIALGPK